MRRIPAWVGSGIESVFCYARAAGQKYQVAGDKYLHEKPAGYGEDLIHNHSKGPSHDQNNTE
jgi:hypothetical protein